MSKKTRFLVSVSLIFGALIFSGCTLSSTSSPSESSQEQRPGVSLDGSLEMVAGKYFLKSGVKTTEISSKKVDLSAFVGKSVAVSGEYSGTTLFVDNVEVK